LKNIPFANPRHLQIGKWYYHFRDGGYRSIEWVEIEVTSPGQLRAAQDVLASIHVPGERTPPGFKVYGYMRPATVLGYVPKPDSSFK
jgi:hypothetical protein